MNQFFPRKENPPVTEHRQTASLFTKTTFKGSPKPAMSFTQHGIAHGGESFFCPKTAKFYIFLPEKAKKN